MPPGIWQKVGRRESGKFSSKFQEAHLNLVPAWPAPVIQHNPCQERCFCCQFFGGMITYKTKSRERCYPLVTSILDKDSVGFGAKVQCVQFRAKVQCVGFRAKILGIWSKSSMCGIPCLKTLAGFLGCNIGDVVLHNCPGAFWRCRLPTKNVHRQNVAWESVVNSAYRWALM